MPWRMRHNAPQLGSPGYASTASVEVVHLPYLKKNSIRQAQGLGIETCFFVAGLLVGGRASEPPGVW